MPPVRKTKSVYKRFASEVSPERDRNSSKTKQRKKNLTDKLGPQWTRGELERFYDAYRKHAGDWRKVAAAVRNNRSVDMVEALFSMNRAYLSLPEGTASVAGLIAMMTDHYSVIEGSESEGDGHDASGVSRKHQKHKRAKTFPSDLRANSVLPAEGCRSFLREIHNFGVERRATGKRTPRVPVPSTYERDDIQGSSPSNKRAKKQLDVDAQAAAFTFTDPSRRGEGPPCRLGKMSQAKEAQSKHHYSSVYGNGVKISRDRRHIKGVPNGDGALLMDVQGVGSRAGPQKRKHMRVEETDGNDSDDSGEACSAAEGLSFKSQKGIVEFKASRDELEVLEALTGFSASLHSAGLMESESSAQLKEERIAKKVDEKSNTLETVSKSHHKENAKQPGAEDKLVHIKPAADKIKPKSAQESVDFNSVSKGELFISRKKRKPKGVDVEASKDSIQNKSLYNKELAEDDYVKIRIKARPAGQGPEKQLKTVKTPAEPSPTSDKEKTGLDSAIQITGSSPANLSQKPPHRRKKSLKKSLQAGAKSSETTHDDPHRFGIFSEHELSKKVSNCLSNPLVRRRCIFEWFYSVIDYPWFAQMEFIDYLNHVGFSHELRLTRMEWGVIKSSLGRPRRFSERFLQRERDQLGKYRDYVRKQYTATHAGATEGLPTDLAQPLSVGNRVIAIHPKTREIRDGKILTVDHDKCTVMFDGSGSDLVMDTDCMPSNPVEYMPEGLRRQLEKCLCVSNEAHHYRHPNSDVSVLFPPSALEHISFPVNHSVKLENINGPISHGKVLATNNSTDQNTSSKSKKTGTEIQRALLLQHTTDMQEMEPELIEIVSDSKSIAQAMVDAAMKAALVKKEEHVGTMVQQALRTNSMVLGNKHKEHSNGSLDYHHHHQGRSLMTNGFISQEGAGKSETLSELITSCVATWLMIQMSAEKQYPPAEVAQLMETAVSSLQPRCPQNMPIYREIQNYMGWIKTRIMALVRA